MNASKLAPLLRRAALAGSLALMAAGAAVADPITLAPQYAGQYGAGNGVDATFLKVADDWKGSGVRYDAVTDSLSNDSSVGRPLVDYGHSGLQGLIDWHTAHSATPPNGLIVDQWSGRVADIAFGDAQYAAQPGYVDTWGAMRAVPLFGSGVADSLQENWTSHFGGFLRITTPGVYNFGVLHDDGFFFTLTGAGGASLGISHDFLNPPSRTAFDQALLLDVGLYRFELGAYEGPGVGVVELAWKFGNGEFERVPGAHLVAADGVSAVPEPATASLLLAGLGLAAVASRRRRIPQ